MELEEIHDAVLEMVSELLQNGANPFAVAGTMSNLALSMYKTTLSPEDFDVMINYISESRERILRMDENRGSFH